MNANQPVDIFYFEGAKTMNGTVGNTALSDQSSSVTGSIARVTSNAHGLTVTSPNNQPAIFLQSLATEVYNGIHRVHAVATNTFDILLSGAFSALTPAGTEAWFVGCSYKSKWKLVGFDLHLSAVGGTSENLTITKDASVGAAFDTLMYTQDMNAVQNLNYRFDPIRELDANDVVKFAYANTNSRTWGLSILAIYGE